ncbi:MAG: aminotransferase class III-fold pyridoxal phosphate-dependent enzyme, partial [Firmicutes bacterium]|nr:aminotransferase class III-fold pyridoxal phosphate-dependent enzyme [Bacillota bacterium]
MLKNEEGKFIINTYNRQPDFTPLITRGKGTLAWDEKGKAYLDFVGGLAVNALGHAPPSVIEAAWEQ